MEPGTLGSEGRDLTTAPTPPLKVKAAVNLYSNNDPNMGLVREFEQHAADKGLQSLVKEAIRFGEKMGISLYLQYPEPKCSDSRGNKMPRENIKNLLKMAVREERKEKFRNENWQGKLLRSRWDDGEL